MATIKSSSSTAAANLALQNNFLLDNEQAQAVLDMKLSRLAHLEVKKLETECQNLIQEAEKIDLILRSPDLLNEEIKRGLREVANIYGDARRTKIINLDDTNNEPVEKKLLQVALTNKNTLFVEEVSSLYTQRRGGVGNKVKMEKGEYFIGSATLETNNTLLLFTNNGNYYNCSTNTLATGEKNSIHNLVPLKVDENICAMTVLSQSQDKPFILFFTKKGFIKKSNISEYNVTKKMGIKAITLEDGDEIVSVIFTNEEKVGILTETGNFVMIETKDVNPIGRVSRGARAIKLNDGDYVKNVRIIPDTTKYFISISGNGLFKKTPAAEFNVQSRNTKGSKIQKLSENDWMADFYPLNDETEILVASTRSCIKLDISDVPELSKGALGNKSIKLQEQDNVVQISIY